MAPCIPLEVRQLVTSDWLSCRTRSDMTGGTTQPFWVCLLGYRIWVAQCLMMKETPVNRLATSITQFTLCQVTTEDIDAATTLLEKARQKLRGIPDTTSENHWFGKYPAPTMPAELHSGQLHNFRKLRSLPSTEGATAYAPYSQRRQDIIGSTVYTDAFAKWRTIVLHERQLYRHFNTTTGRWWLEFHPRSDDCFTLSRLSYATRHWRC